MDMKHCMYNVHHLNHVLFEGIWNFDAGIEVAYESAIVMCPIAGFTWHVFRNTILLYIHIN